MGSRFVIFYDPHVLTIPEPTPVYDPGPDLFRGRILLFYDFR
jgi:hypothetical protein